VKIIRLDQDLRSQSARLAIPDLGLAAPTLTARSQSATLSFVADRTGTFGYTGETGFGG